MIFVKLNKESGKEAEIALIHLLYIYVLGCNKK